MNTITVTETAAVQATSDQTQQEAVRQAQAVLDRAQTAVLAGETTPPGRPAPPALHRLARS